MWRQKLFVKKKKKTQKSSIQISLSTFTIFTYIRVVLDLMCNPFGMQNMPNLVIYRLQRTQGTVGGLGKFLKSKDFVFKRVFKNSVETWILLSWVNCARSQKAAGIMVFSALLHCTILPAALKKRDSCESSTLSSSNVLFPWVIIDFSYNYPGLIYLKWLNVELPKNFQLKNWLHINILWFFLAIWMS